MRPIDPRLLRYARSTRGFLVLAVVLGAVLAVLVIVQARLLSQVIVDVAEGRADVSSSARLLLALAFVVGGRALLSWLGESAAYRTSATAKAQLRQSALDHVLALGPAGPAQDAGAVATLVTRGVDALDAYYARYLPQLLLAVIVPVAVLLTILGQDLLSAAIIAVTLPLIPVFMILIGLYTRGRVDRQWRTLAHLSGHFLDLVAGLPTLKVLGRAQAQVQAIRAMGDRYRTATMGVLRITFLSSLALELLASLSVALVAVSVGLRLAEGQVTFSVALFVLVLAPEAYLPLRLVGQHFHAAAEGLGAAEQVFALLETPAPVEGTRADLPRSPTIDLRDLTFTYPGRTTPALYPTRVSFTPGSMTALVGPSGGGKSTLLALLLGFLSPSGGVITLAGTDLAAVDLREYDVTAWRRRLGWVPQAPHLTGATVGAAVRLGRPEADDDDVRRALASAGLDLPLDTPVGHDGSGVSAGQARRVALARALLVEPDVLLLDEPTAALDGESEQAVIAALRRARAEGRTVIVVAHRPALVDAADQVAHIGPPLATDIDTGGEPADLVSADRAAWQVTRGTLTRSDF